MSGARAADGFLFGLTLTEIMILFVFLLALLIGVAARESAAREADLAELRDRVERDAAWADRVLGALDRPGPVRAVGTRLELERRVVDLDARLETLVRDAAASRAELDGLRSLLGADGPGHRATLAALVRTVEAVAADVDESPGRTLERLSEAAESFADPGRCETALSELRTRHEGLLARGTEVEDEVTARTNQLENCSARVRFLVERHAREAGRGASHPPCWVGPDNRNEYLFEVTMRPEGYRIASAWRAERTDDAAAIPGVTALAGREVPAGRFVALTAAIFERSVAEDCRHFVRVRDELGNDKGLYKQRLDRIERHFYKRLL